MNLKQSIGLIGSGLLPFLAAPGILEGDENGGDPFSERLFGPI